MNLEAFFFAALEQGSAAERAAYLDEACAGDDELRQRVERMLSAHADAGSFLESSPAADYAPTAAMPAAPISEAAGTVIGSYKLLEQIGEGGFGVVFMAEQVAPVRRKVALKVIKPGMDTRQVIARFNAERQALAVMDHPNIAQVFEAGATASGRPYFVMELVRGLPITAYCDEHNLPVPERLELFAAVCQAIQHAHTKGIIHRDIKPTNVLVTRHDGRPVVKVIDFGVAKAMGQQLTDKTLFTEFAQMVGTPLYMSPEQAELSSLDIDTRSDIYSLGVLLYELLTGSTPVDKDDLKKAAFDEIRRIIREDEPQRPSLRISGSHTLPAIAAHRHIEPARLSKLIRGELDWIVMKALEKDRTRRYETANGFASDVQRYLNDETVQACPPSAAYRFRKFARRNSAALAMVAVVFSAMLLATIGLAVSNVLVRGERNEKVAALGQKEQALSEKQAALGEKEVALREAKTNYAEAKRQEGLAQASAEDARRQQRVAQEQEALARRRFYAAQMNLAMQAWDAGQPARMLQLLESQRPRFDQEDVRGFDWYYLWRLCQGAYRYSLPTRNYDNASAVAISPDGKTMASGYGHTVALWDVTTGSKKGELLGHENLVGWVAFAPDGKTLASSDESETLRVWDLATGQERTILQPGQVVTGMQFTGDSQKLVLGGRSVKLWDLVANQEVVALGESDHPFRSVSVAPEGNAVVASGLDAVRTWTQNGDGWKEGPRVTGGGYYAPVAISPDGRLLAVGGHILKLYDLSSQQERITFRGHTGQVHALAFANDGQRLISGGQDRAIRIWDVATGELLLSIANPGPIYGLALAPDASVVAAMGTDAIRLWDTAPPVPAVVLHHTARVHGVAFLPDGKTVASYGQDGTRLWDTTDGREIRTLADARPSQTRDCGFAISPDGRTLAMTGSVEGTVDLWDVTGRRLSVLNGCGFRLAFSPDGQSLAVASDNGAAGLWNLQSQELRHRLPVSGSDRAISVAFSPDGKIIAAGGQFGVVKLFDAKSGQELNTLQRYELAVDWVWALAFSPDGRKLATGNKQGLVRIWDVDTNRLVVSLIGHISGVRSVAFTDDGKTLATGSDDRTIRIWDVETGQERMTLRGHEQGVTGLAFAPDGDVLATSSSDGTLRLWRAAAHRNAPTRKRETDSNDAQSPAADNELGDRLWQYGRTDEAETAYRHALGRLEKMIAASPDDVAYKQERVRSLLSISVLLWAERNQHPDAEPLRRRARELYRDLSPDDQAALLFAYGERHRNLYDSGHGPQVKRTFSQMIELIPDDDVGGLTRAADHLTACPDVKLRNPGRAAELTGQAVAACRKARPATREASYKLAEGCALLARFLRDNQKLETSAGIFRQAISLREPLDDAPCEIRSAQANDYNDLAFVLRRTEGLTAAEQTVREALALKEGLATEFPAQPEYRFHVAHSWLGLAHILEESGRISDAVQAFGEAGTRLSAVAADAAATADVRQWSAHALWGLGDVWLRLKEFDEADRVYRDALEVFRKLHVEFPARDDYPREQLVSYRKLAGLMLTSGQSQGAAAGYGHVLEIEENVAAAQRGNAAYRNELAGTLAYLGLVLEQGRQPQQAAEAHAKALALWKQLSAEDPGNEWYRQERAYFSRGLAVLLLAAGRSEDALEHCRTTIRLNEQLVADFADTPHHRPRLADARGVLISLLSSLGRDEELGREVESLLNESPSADALNHVAWLLCGQPNPSTGAAQEAVKMAQRAVELSPNAGPMWNTLGVAHYRAGNWPAAIEAFQHSRDLLGDKLISWDAFFLAMAHFQRGEKAEARRWYDRAVAWMDQQAADNTELRRFRAEAEELLRPRSSPEERTTEPIEAPRPAAP